MPALSYVQQHFYLEDEAGVNLSFLARVPILSFTGKAHYFFISYSASDIVIAFNTLRFMCFTPGFTRLFVPLVADACMPLFHRTVFERYYCIIPDPASGSI